MSSVDKRVVEMQFNNSQFESGVQTSLKSLDNLKKGLDLEGATKGLSNLDKVGRSFSLAGIASGVETISSRFTTLGIIGVTALQNITNSAINAGKQIVSALTIDPITTGFNEYELKMGSIQTIMAGTGESLETVNKYLNELNTYSDKTIYSFSDMTQNIGKFTNAGVSLKDSVSAIQGVANVAAVSGANANEASRAMYNFAQALSSGYVKLIDWKSIELANMGTVEFKQQLIDAAVAAGTLTKTADGLYKTLEGSVLSATQGFNDSLQDQWMTTEVLVNTLGDYADATTEIGKKAFAAAQDVKTFSQLFDTLKEAAQSGWAQTWELVVGDFEEAKALLTEINNVIGNFIGASADARNSMIQTWKDLGGRTALIEALGNAFKGLVSFITPIHEAFKEIFPSTTGEQLFAMTEALKALTARFTISETTATNLKRTFKGLFAILDIGKQLFLAIAGGVGDFLSSIIPAGDGLLAFTGNIGDWLVALDESIKKSGIFVIAVQKIETFMSKVSEGVKTAVTAMIEVFQGFKDVDLSGVDSFTEKLKIRFEPFGKLAEFVATVFGNTLTILKKVAPLFVKFASMLGDAFVKLQEKIIGGLDNTQFNSVFDLINSVLLGGILVGLRKFIKSLTGITDEAGGFLKGITGILDGVKGSLEAYQSSLKANTLLKIAIAIGILAAALIALSLIDSEKLTVSLAAMTAMFAELFGSMAIFEKIMGSAGFKSMGRVTTAMIGLSVAVLILSIAMGKLAKLDWEGIEKGLISVGALMAMMVTAAKVLSQNSGSVIKGALGFILFAAAINLLATAVERLGAIDIVSLSKGLVAVGVLMTELAVFMKVTDLSGMGVTKGVGILLLATSLVILASAVKKLSEIDIGALAKGLGAIGVLLTELALFVNLTGGAKNVISTAIGLTILAAAMLIFAEALARMGSMSLEQIGKGLLTMAASLAAITVAINFMPKNMVGIGLGMLGIATAMLILSSALQEMGAMSWEEIAKGLVTLAGSLTIIAVAMQFMTSALPGAAALLVISVALTVLAKVLKTLGRMSLVEIGKGLLALVGVFAVLGVAGLVLAPLTPVLLGLASAMLLLGVAMLALGAGVLLLSTGLTALAVAGTAGVVALVSIVTALIGLIPMVIEQIGLGIIAFAGVITAGMPAIMEAIGALFAGIIQLLGELTPPLIETVLNFILELLTKLVEYVPQFVDAGMKIIIGFLQGIANNISGVVQAGIDIVLNFLDGIAQKIPDIIDMAFKLIISFINGLADAIRNNSDAIFDACENLIDAIIDAITSLLGRLPKIGMNIVSGLVEGVKSMGRSLINAAKGVVQGAIDAAKKLLGIHSPSTVFASIGVNTGKGFIEGLKAMATKVAGASEDVGTGAVDSMSNALAGVSDALNTDVDLQPTIRPVIDMTDVENGLNSTFGKQQTLDVSESAATASKVSTSGQSVATTGSGDTVTDNTNNAKIQITNYYTVRSDSDIRKISQEQKNLLDRYSLAKGVAVTS